MSKISCGSCKGKHDTVAQVAECFNVGRGGARPATERQLNFAHMLYRERQPLEWQSGDEEKDHADINDMDFNDISQYIEQMQKQPSRPKDHSKRVATTVAEGIYKSGDTVYKVQLAHHGSGRPYAKRLEIEQAGVPDPRGGHTVRSMGTFVYDPMGLQHCIPQNKMSLEEAKEFGALYGFCIKCGRILTDEKSIADGIGPVCGAKDW